MQQLVRSTRPRWYGPPCEAKQPSAADCLRLRLPDMPLARPVGRMAWRWPDGTVSGLVYRIGTDPAPHALLAYGSTRQIVPLVPGSRSGWVTRAFLCACGHRTRILWLPRHATKWRCKVCHQVTPAVDRHESRYAAKSLSRATRWATITARARSTRAQPRAAGAHLFGPSMEWATLDDPPPAGHYSAAVGPLNRF